jgi:hypothetical protein
VSCLNDFLTVSCIFFMYHFVFLTRFHTSHRRDLVLFFCGPSEHSMCQECLRYLKVISD